jgi:GNAT superfamily N-acetyltransferase
MKADPATPFLVEVLSEQHERAAFSCGVEALDRYFREQAGQDVRRRIAVVFVLVERATGRVAGYFTLASTGLVLEGLPPEMARKLPRYPMLPATLLGRLAVDQRHHGQGLGKLLLLDALRRSWEASRKVASLAVVADPKDDAARRFYVKFGFLPLSAAPCRLFLPMKTVEELVGEF